MSERSKLNTAAFIDLKAELLRKQELLKQTKLQRTDGFNLKSFKLKNESKVSKKKQTPEPGQEVKVDDELEKQLAKSRSILEQKALLYDKITTGTLIPTDNDSSCYLVDFNKKVSDEKTNPIPKIIPDPAPNVVSEEEFKIPENNEDWVEYTDSQGKQRCCLRDDLPSLLNTTKAINYQGKMSKNNEPNLEQNFKTDQPIVEENVGPVHYQDVRDNEIRTHGIGYFAFSGDEKQRKEQIEMLNNMRDQTVKQREARQKVKERRNELLNARLAKVRQRKNIPMPEKEELEEDTDETIVSEIPLPEEPQIENKPVKNNVRPWDKGKDFSEVSFFQPKIPKLSLSEKYVEDRRGERQTDFAPPQFYTKKKFHPKIEEHSDVQEQEPNQAVQLENHSSSTSLETNPSNSSGLETSQSNSNASNQSNNSGSSWRTMQPFSSPSEHHFWMPHPSALHSNQFNLNFYDYSQSQTNWASQFQGNAGANDKNSPPQANRPIPCQPPPSFMQWNRGPPNLVTSEEKIEIENPKPSAEEIERNITEKLKFFRNLSYGTQN